MPAAPEPGLWRNRDFTLLLAGSSVSVLGDRLALMAFPLLVLAETGSPAAAGWVGFAGLLPAVPCYLLAAPLVERSGPRRCMAICEGCRGVAVLLVVLALLGGRASVPELAVAVFAEGTCAALYSIAEVKMIGAIVPAAQIASALARNEARGAMASLLGRPLGGLLYGLGRLVPFLADLLSFAISVTTLLLIRRAPGALAAEPRPPARLAGAVWGLRYAARDRFLRVSIPVMAVSNLIIQALYIVFVATAISRGLPPGAIGAAFAATGAGGILGAATAGPLLRRTGYRAFPLAQWSWVAAITPLLVTINQYTFAATMAVMSATGVTANVSAGNYFYQRVPEHMLARVMSVDLLATYLAAAAGPLAGGLLVSALGGPAAIQVLGGVVLLLAVAAACARPGGKRQAHAYLAAVKD